MYKDDDENMGKIIILQTDIVLYNAFKKRNLPEILEEFIKNDSPDNITLIYKTLMDLQSVYPNFYQWYNNKVVKDLKLKRNNRNIFLAVSKVSDNGNVGRRLSGIAITKRNSKESKICTFRVFPEYQGQGVGTALLNVCFEYLKTNKPLISISKKNLASFQRIIDKYDWKRTQILPNYYKEGFTEYVYNGKLKEKRSIDAKN